MTGAGVAVASRVRPEVLKTEGVAKVPGVMVVADAGTATATAKAREEAIVRNMEGSGKDRVEITYGEI